MGDASDRLILAEIAGTCERRSWQVLAGKCSDAEAAAELAEASRGRADLLTQWAGIITGATESGLSATARQGREGARLCVLAGADPDGLGPWIEAGRKRTAAARVRPFTGIG
jgi:hypothetical protein